MTHHKTMPGGPSFFFYSNRIHNHPIGRRVCYPAVTVRWFLRGHHYFELFPLRLHISLHALTGFCTLGHVGEGERVRPFYHTREKNTALKDRWERRISRESRKCKVICLKLSGPKCYREVLTHPSLSTPQLEESYS